MHVMNSFMHNCLLPMTEWEEWRLSGKGDYPRNNSGWRAQGRRQIGWNDNIQSWT